MTPESSTKSSLLRVGIVGVSGYTGRELLRLLLQHPQVRVTHVCAQNTQGPCDEIWPELRGLTRLSCRPFDPVALADQTDLVFCAVPHTQAMTLVPKLRERNLTVIDLSADYRLKSFKDFEKAYDVVHQDAVGIKKAVYGLPELNRSRIARSRFVSNPGCYPTAAILGLAPILTCAGETVQHIVIDAKSGVSGAGRKISVALSFCEVNENFKAYKALVHQHTPEIEQWASRIRGRSVKVTFVPHLLPIQRGLYATMYVFCDPMLSVKKLHALTQKFYKTEPFVRVRPFGEIPELKNVVGTNFCDIGLTADTRRQCVVIFSAIDNLLKGAAGQAVQNMNILQGCDETTGLWGGPS